VLSAIFPWIRAASVAACVVLVAGAFLAAGCGGGEEEEEPAVSVSVDEPAEGATVASPVAVVLSAEGLEEGAHLHLLVDLPCDEPGTSEPPGEQRLRLGVGVEGTELELAPGEHTLCAQVADAAHVAGEATAKVTFEVEGGGASAGATTTEEEDAEGQEIWKGPVTGEFQAGPDCTPGVSDGEISLVVDEGGAVDGEGSATSSEYTCTFPEGSTTIPESTLSYGIGGTRGADSMTLEFPDGVTMELAIDGTTAIGTQDNSAGGGYTSVTNVELTCVSGC
jgi:hypothetical protein